MAFSTVGEALKNLKKGIPVIVVDSEHRENEGDLVLAAEKANASNINFMIKNAGGLICVPMKGELLDKLKIPLMVDERENTELTKCRFTISVDFKHGTTTGISASDRAKTINALAEPKSKPEDFAKPGHVFPLRYQEGGVLAREGHTEAAVDLCVLAGLKPVGVICEILREDGEAAKRKDLEKLSKKHNLKMITIEELAEYRKNI
jgi:3,4-dihydroxy-2-butanone 4-phosphate synthase